MADVARVEQVKAENVAAEIGKLIAADVHWMAQRFDVAGVTDAGIRAMDNGPIPFADTRYTRLLRVLADQLVTGLEKEAGIV